MNFTEIIKEFTKLSSYQQIEFFSSLQERQKLDLSQAFLERDERVICHNTCFYCHSKKVYRAGKKLGVQKFHCLDCNKNFNANTGTALYYIKHRDKWIEYIRLMEQGLSIRKIASELGICIQTSFDWRHKILASLKSYIPKQLAGVVEVGEIVMPESQKGNKNLKRKPRKRGIYAYDSETKMINVLTIVNRTKGGTVQVIDSEKLTEDQVCTVLCSCIAKNAVIITRKSKAFKNILHSLPEIKHRVLKQKIKRNEIPKNGIHLKSVKLQHEQIFKFLYRFHGVATRYLTNYLNWYLFTQQNKEKLGSMKSIVSLSISSSSTLAYYRDIKQFRTLYRT